MRPWALVKAGVCRNTKRVCLMLCPREEKCHEKPILHTSSKRKPNCRQQYALKHALSACSGGVYHKSRWLLFHRVLVLNIYTRYECWFTVNTVNKLTFGWISQNIRTVLRCRYLFCSIFQRQRFVSNVFLILVCVLWPHFRYFYIASWSTQEMLTPKTALNFLHLNKVNHYLIIKVTKLLFPIQ